MEKCDVSLLTVLILNYFVCSLLTNGIPQNNKYITNLCFSYVAESLKLPNCV